MARLVTTVHARNPRTGESGVFGPYSEDVPAWVSRVVTNPKAWDETPTDTSDDDDSDGGKGDDPNAGGVAPTGDEKPTGNASTSAWYTYALAHGHTDDDLADLGRDEIRALFD